MESTTRPLLQDNRLRLLGALLSLLAVSLFVVRGSYAVFSDTTDNTENNWATGSLDLTNKPDRPEGAVYGDETTAEFHEDLLIPGDSGSGCIDVRYGGAVLAAADLTNVELYTTNLTETDGGADAARLSGDLDLDIQIYGTDESCATTDPTRSQVYAGTLAGLNDDVVADTGWKPSEQGEERAFEFNWTLRADTPNEAQGDSVKVDFNWEIRTADPAA